MTKLQREVFSYHKNHPNKTRKQIAKRFGIATGTVSNYITKGYEEARRKAA